MDKQRLQELAGISNELLNEGEEYNFVLKRGDGSFIDKGGRRTLKLSNAKMFSSKEKAKKFLDGGSANIYVKPGTDLKDVKIALATMTNESVLNENVESIVAELEKVVDRAAKQDDGIIDTQTIINIIDKYKE